MLLKNKATSCPIYSWEIILLGSVRTERQFLIWEILNIIKKKLIWIIHFFLNRSISIMVRYCNRNPNESIGYFVDF